MPALRPRTASPWAFAPPLVSSPPMDDTIQGFLPFLRSMDLRIFQERDIALDICLSGFWALMPVLLAIVSATVFLLAIFKIIPQRRHAIGILLAAGVAAAGIGLGGTWLRYKASLVPEAPPARVLVEGKGADPTAKPGRTEAVLALPLLLGGLTLAADFGGFLFLLMFWGENGRRKKGKAPGP